MEEELLHKEITEKIIKAFYKVYNQLGFGFLERVYENAMFIELTNIGFHCERQKYLDVYYKGNRVGEFFADILVENKVIVELKATEVIVKDFENQLINYLKSSDIEVGLLLNFWKKPEFKRKIFTNNLKHNSKLK
jgi:GxxExxY protein